MQGDYVNVRDNYTHENMQMCFIKTETIGKQILIMSASNKSDHRIFSLTLQIFYCYILM